MRVEVLTSEGCLNAESTRELVRQAAQLEAVDATIEYIDVNTPEVAQQAPRFAARSLQISQERI